MASANKITIFGCAFWCFVLGVILLPIGLGGNRPIPFGLAQAAFALSCFGLVLGRRKWQPPQLFLRLRVALLLFAAVILWAFLQTQPFMPAAWMHPIWQEAGEVLGRHLRGAIAISPEDSLAGLSRLVTYIAAGILAYLLAQDPKRARKMVEALWVSGVLICLYGLIDHVTGWNKVLWFDKWAYQGDVTATFVNRNDFAVYSGLVLISGAALLARSWHQQVQTKMYSSEAVRAWLTRGGGARLLALALVLLCIVLSHSRAGLVVSIAGLGGYFFLYQIYRKEWRHAFLTAFIACVVLVLAVAAAREYSARFAHLFSDYSSTDRIKVYSLTIQALRDNPWLGYGLDGFQPVFRLYQRGMIMEFTHAHSDVLESLLDLGLPMGLVLWAAIGLLVSGLARGVAHRRRHGMFPALGLASCIVMIPHALVDFSMQIPGVVVPWAMLAGCGLAQSWGQSGKEPVHEWVE